MDLGIHHPSVRFVFHLGPPLSLDLYVFCPRVVIYYNVDIIRSQGALDEMENLLIAQFSAGKDLLFFCVVLLLLLAKQKKKRDRK